MHFFFSDAKSRTSARKTLVPGRDEHEAGEPPQQRSSQACVFRSSRFALSSPSFLPLLPNNLLTPHILTCVPDSGDEKKRQGSSGLGKKAKIKRGEETVRARLLSVFCRSQITHHSFFPQRQTFTTETSPT
jgi:hypothetical protein